MKRFHLPPLACIGLSAVAVLVACLALSSLFVPKNNQASFGQIDEAAFGVLGEPTDSLDVLFVGDSEVYHSLSPLQMWNEQGFTSYDIATSGQPLCYSKTILSRALEKQNPRVVVFETNMIFRKMKADQILWREAANLFPIIEYHNRWKHLTPADLTAQPKATWTHPAKGFRPNEQVVPSKIRDHMKPTTDRERISPLNEWYLTSMIDMCRDRGIKVVLLSTPSTKNWNTQRHNAVQAYLDSKGYGSDVSYLDLNYGDTELPIDWQVETSDAGDHLNIRGARKVSHYVGEWLRANYDLTDHRGESAYRQWTQTSANLG
ncbi:hypothetical protein [Collinsella intestinalis]|uniref:hypothetical protein n=1 Tax=Collinsella intestinalis TaxID=147207 RepID=UPI00195D28B3|nr:hypothetical protein [Collinsella intestinalis]MBM6908592.1 hypothetical protein [Collinsella intestinalis]